MPISIPTLIATAPASAERPGRDSTEAVDETLTEHDPQASESMQTSDDSLSERDAGDIESDDRPDAETEAIESIEKRPGINGAVRPRRRS